MVCSHIYLFIFVVFFKDHYKSLLVKRKYGLFFNVAFANTRA